MHRTRLTATAGAVAALSLTVAACGGGEGSDAGGEVGGEIAYSFWGNPDRGRLVEEVASLFAEEHPGATVDAEVADYLAYIERLTVRAAGGDLACATGTQTTFLSQYAENGVLRPLDDLIESGEIDTSEIPEDVLAAGQVDGEQVMIPTGTFVRVLAYNADLAESAGVSAPGDDMTWAEYADWLRAMRGELPDGVYPGENEGGIMFTLTSWVVGHGEQMFDGDELGFDRELLTEYFEYWIGLAEDEAVIPPAMIPTMEGALELTPMATRQVVAGTRDIPHIYIMEEALAGAGDPEDVAWTSMPSESPDRPANVLGANGISIPTDCDNVATAAAFVDFFANDTDAALAFRSDNGILTNQSAQDALLDDPETPDGVKQNVTILQELTDAGDLATTTYPAGLNTMTNELRRVYSAAAFGEMSVDEAVESFFSAADEALS